MFRHRSGMMKAAFIKFPYSVCVCVCVCVCIERERERGGERGEFKGDRVRVVRRIIMKLNSPSSTSPPLHYFNFIYIATSDHLNSAKEHKSPGPRNYTCLKLTSLVGPPITPDLHSLWHLPMSGQIRHPPCVDVSTTVTVRPPWFITPKCW